MAPTAVVPERGKLLIARPMSLDANFDQTVVLLIEHNDEGSLGVVLNRPLDMAVSDALADWSEVAAGPSVVFAGGPVGQGSVLAVGEAPPDDAPDGFARFAGPLGVIDLAAEPPPASFRRVRIFSGYSGWGPGQLADELSVDAWFVVDAQPDDAFTGTPSDLWSAVLRRQGGSLGRVGLFPTDPQLN